MNQKLAIIYPKKKIIKEIIWREGKYNELINNKIEKNL